MPRREDPPHRRRRLRRPPPAGAAARGFSRCRPARDRPQRRTRLPASSTSPTRRRWTRRSRGWPPTDCIHLAAIAVVPLAARSPDLAWRVNLHGTLTLADALVRHAPGCRLLHRLQRRCLRPLLRRRHAAGRERAAGADERSTAPPRRPPTSRSARWPASGCMRSGCRPSTIPAPPVGGVRGPRLRPAGRAHRSRAAAAAPRGGRARPGAGLSGRARRLRRLCRLPARGGDDRARHHPQHRLRHPPPHRRHPGRPAGHGRGHGRDRGRLRTAAGVGNPARVRRRDAGARRMLGWEPRWRGRTRWPRCSPTGAAGHARRLRDAAHPTRRPPPAALHRLWRRLPAGPRRRALQAAATLARAAAGPRAAAGTRRHRGRRRTAAPLRAWARRRG